MYTILYPIMGKIRNKESVIDYLAGHPGGDELEIKVLYVKAEIDVIGSDGGYVSVTHDDLEVPDYVTEMVSELRSAGCSVDATVRAGEGIVPVLNAIDEHDVNAVVIGDRRRSAVGKAMFGSDTLDVINDSPVPVTLIVPGDT